MKTVTYKKLKPLIEVGMPTDYKASALDFIKEYRDKVKNKADIIWAVTALKLLSDKDLRLFAVWCAREALKLINNPDTKSIEACNVAERYANSEATDEELKIARDAARAAAYDAARDKQVDKIVEMFESEAE